MIKNEDGWAQFYPKRCWKNHVVDLNAFISLCFFLNLGKSLFVKLKKSIIPF
jgi:hypothetical protein